jgi:hypothetical protein
MDQRAEQREEALAVARKVRTQKRQNKREIDELKQRITDLAVEAHGVPAERIDVHLYGEGLSQYVIYVWDEDGKSALAYHLPDVD